jgi:DNA-binding transcriptional ArsR family regulator
MTPPRTARTARRSTPSPYRAEAFSSGRPNPPSLAAVADADTVDRVFKALDNPVRRGILGAISDWDGPMRSSTIAQRFDIPWQGVSRHLRELTDAGLVVCEKVTNGRQYSLNETQLRAVAARWIERVAAAPKRA